MPLANRILDLLVVLCEPVSMAVIADCLRRQGVRVQEGELDAALAELRRRLAILPHDDGFWCSPFRRETLARKMVEAGQFEEVARLVKQAVPVARSWNRTAHFRSRAQALREVRIAFYRRDARALQQTLWEMDQQFPPNGFEEPALVSICNTPFHAESFRLLPPAIRAVAAGELLSWSALHLQACPHLLTVLKDTEPVPAAVRVFLADILILRGRLQEALDLIADVGGPACAVRQGWVACLRGANDEAISLFEGGLHDLRRGSAEADAFYRTYGGLFYLLALLKSGSTAHLDRLDGVLGQVDAVPLWRPLCALIRRLADRMRSRPAAIGAAGSDPAAAWTSPASLLLLELVVAGWLDPAEIPAEKARALYARLQEDGYDWAASEAGALVASLGGAGADAAGAAAGDFRTRTGVQGLVGAVRLAEAWERALEALGQLSAENQGDADLTETRIAWFLTVPSGSGEALDLRPVEQRLSGRGRWTRGRAIPLRRLYTMGERPETMTDQDHRVCAAITATPDQWDQQNTTYAIRAEAALPELVGHPHLYLDGEGGTHVELVSGNPELIIKEEDGMLRLHMEPRASAQQRVAVLREAPGRLRLIRFAPIHRQLGAILGDSLAVPVQARDRVREVIAPLTGNVSVQSDIGSMEAGTTVVAADETIHVHLLPAGAGLQVQLYVQPFGEAGPAYVPGRGGSTVVAALHSRRLEVARDLPEERRRAHAVAAACSVLCESPHAEWSWSFPEPEVCLDLLQQLRLLGDDVRVKWPQGQSFSLSRSLGLSDLRLDIRRQRDWLAVSGSVQVNEDLALSISELIRLVALNPGRFVSLGEGRFLALTDEFRRRINDLAALGEIRGTGLRCHALTAGILGTIAEDAGEVTADDGWKVQLDHIAAAAGLNPEIPSTLCAELRDYQLEGYRWLCRLAAWGAGGCLADDMGLGKTVQALAVILARAAAGPSLVVAPTSVCLNWRDEAARFTPTLKVRLYGSGDRRESIETAGPFDLVVCTYGLMQTGRDILDCVPWQTIVLDEAQAIKNPRAKRSQAACKLHGQLRLITTGTPIENNLNELWSLFRFINPGLLGSQQQFNERFAQPIERHDDPDVRHRLKRLISPFVLRRTKSQVLEELPARTETLLHVQLSEKERAFYEALRRESLQRIGSQDGSATARRMRILAEITRLRQACCSPRLILPGSDLPSAKLEALDTILDELTANRHKALVFSQFVSHLKIVREHVEKRGIAYQYLDGATLQKERAERVAAFQEGQGEVFLISLRAGGTGLNLTAADYVVHMDPWWNPAVEDQASDRAHRIGQFRPVTIYRLVAADTIEDKIVELHRRKRDLADSLLSGSDVPATVSAEELLRLMAED